MSTKPPVSRTLLTANRSPRGGRAIDHIVIHYTTSRNIEGSIKHFLNGSPRVSAHYIVGRDGELVQMVPDSEAAWHAGNSDMNARSIGIEHVAAVGDAMTTAQEATSAALIRWLCDTYGILRGRIIPHVAVKSTSCPGDLFAAYGGKAGADKARQTAALQAWLAERVFPDSPAPIVVATKQTEVPMTEDAPMPAETPAQTKPASQSLTVWGAITTLLATLTPVAAQKWGIPVTPELVLGLAGVAMTVFGRVGASTSIKLG